MIIMLVTMTAAAAGAPPSPRPNDKIVCRSITMTGSRLARKRVCLARSEWARISRDAARETNAAGARILGPSRE